MRTIQNKTTAVPTLGTGTRYRHSVLFQKVPVRHFSKIYCNNLSGYCF